MFAAVVAHERARARIVARLQAWAAKPPSQRRTFPGGDLAVWDLAPRARIVGAAAVAGSVRGDAQQLAHSFAEPIAALRGDHALALPLPGGLILARGGFGGRPCYYARGDDGWVACSRLEGVLAALDAAPPLDVPKLVTTVLDEPADDPEATFYRDIREVPLGCAVRLSSDGSVKLLRGSHEVTPRDGSVEELAADLKEQMFAAVRRSIGEKQRVGVMTGGGLDSSALLAIAVALARGASKSEIEALAVDFAGPGDDRPYLRDLERDLGIVALRVKPGQFGHVLRSSFVADAAPLTWPNVAWEIGLLRQARARGVDLVLLGVGGDEVFGGDPRALADQALRGKVVGAIRSAWRLRDVFHKPGWRCVADYVVRPLAARWQPAWMYALRASGFPRVPTWHGPTMEETLARVVRKRRATARLPMDPCERVLSRGTTQEVLDNMGRLEAATGCTIACPYLDDDLIELVARIRPEVMLHGGQLRGLFRLAMRGVLPETIRSRRDKARFEPAFQELIGSAGGWDALRDLMSMRELGALGIVDPVRFRRDFEQGVRTPERPDMWMEMWSALAVEAFVRAHLHGDMGVRRAASTQATAEARV